MTRHIVYCCPCAQRPSKRKLSDRSFTFFKMAGKRCIRCLWESDIQWKARSQFIETWKNHYSEERLAALSMVWANMKFLGCRYPSKTEELVKELEAKGPRISLPDKSVKKPKPLIGNFTIYEPKEGDESTNNNPVSILNESAQKSKKTISFEDLGFTEKTSLFSCAVIIADKLIAAGEGPGKKQAKRIAAEKALEILRACQPVKRLGPTSQQHQNAACVSKTDLVSKAYVTAPIISDDNIGNQLLRKMGWTGSGGIGKDCHGRTEPVMAVGTDRKFGLGCNPTQGADVTKGSVQDVLLSFISGGDQQIKFSNELSKEDRAIIHTISQRYGLKHRSYGKGQERYLVVSKD